MQNKKYTFCYSLRRKCIANLYTQPMHFGQDFGKYRTQKVMKEIVAMLHFSNLLLEMAMVSRLKIIFIQKIM